MRVGEAFRAVEAVGAVGAVEVVAPPLGGGRRVDLFPIPAGLSSFFFLLDDVSLILIFSPSFKLISFNGCTIADDDDDSNVNLFA